MKKILSITFAAAAVMSACQKIPTVIDADGEFLVATTYADDTDFSKYTTFSVADSVFFIDSYFGGEMVKSSFTDGLVDEFKQMMESCGYEYVPIEDKTDNVEDGSDAAGDGSESGAGDGSDTPPAYDLGIQLTYVYDTDYYVDYVDPYWWLDYTGYWSPYWSGAWYYPYPVTYEFSTHSLIADMADLTVTGDDGESHPIVWNCTVNGEPGSANADYRRFKAAIRQAFEQSGYLKKVSE